MSRRLKDIINKIVLLTSLFGGVTLFVSLASVPSECYNALWIWPLSYIIYSILVFSYIKNEHYLGIVLVTLTQLFPRYVIYPFVVAGAYNGYNGIRQCSISNGDVFQAIIFGCIEILGLGVFIWFFERIKRRSLVKGDGDYHNEIYLSGNKYIYLLYIVFAIIIYLVIGRKYNVIQFLVISNSYADIQTNIYLTLIKYIVSIALCVTVLMIISSQKKKYDIDGASRHAYFAIVSSMLYVCVVIGESRGTQIAIGVLICFILSICFPSKIKTIVISITACVVIVVASITLFRTGTGIVNSWTMDAVADKLQVYYGGPESIAQSIIVMENEVGIGQVLFDFVRSIFPFNLLLKGTGFTVSQQYNLALYNGLSTHGQIVFGSSYGFMAFGIIGVPITICLNVYLILKASTIFSNSLSLEMKYVSGYCLIRLLAATLVNTPSILGSVTQYIGTFGLLIFVSRRIFINRIRGE